jgi:hypothetical protein
MYQLMFIWRYWGAANAGISGAVVYKRLTFALFFRETWNLNRSQELIIKVNAYCSHGLENLKKQLKCILVEQKHLVNSDMVVIVV